MMRKNNQNENMVYTEGQNSLRNQAQYSNENRMSKTSQNNWQKQGEQFVFGQINTRIKNQNIARVDEKKTVFSNETLRIELKEGFDKDFVLKIVKVLIDAQ